MAPSSVGLIGLAVMGQVRSGCVNTAPLLQIDDRSGLCALQNLALNVAEKGFSISVFNRTYDKTEAAVKRAQKEGAPGRTSSSM